MPKDRASKPKRWPDGTVRTTDNAFTGHGYSEADRRHLSRTELMNGKMPHTKGVIPWNGPYTRREPK